MLLRFLILAFFVMTTATHAQTPLPIDAGVSQTLAKWRAANYSDVRYRLNLTLEKMSPVLKGTIEVSLKNNAEQIVLDWRKIRGKEDASTVSNISVNGKAAKFEETNEHLVFRENVVKGENIIKLDFTSPIATSGAAITRYVDKEDAAEYVYSLFVPSDASTAFPVFDQPDLKARFSLSVELPEEWQILSNTEVSRESRIEINHCQKNCIQRKLFFYPTKPISTYVFAFAAGNFDVFKECFYSNEAKGKDVSKCFENSDKPETRDYAKIYVRKSQAEKFKPHAAETFRLNREGVKYLESYFDYKFPFPKYDLVLIPEFPFGGMEHAGATFLRESSVIFPSEPTANDYISRANLIFHEAAHQWFGDTVTMKWFDDLWLKEGFAEFMAYKTLEKVLPEYNAWKAFYERNKPLAYLTDSTRGTTPIYQEIPNLSQAKSAYGNIVYRKAPSFLRQAEFYLGEDKFQTAVRGFLKKHEFANAEWSDLVAEFQNVGWLRDELGYKNSNAKDREKYEEVSKKTIESWAESWVKQKGLPIVRGGFFKQSSTGKILGYGLSQKASQEPEIGENVQWWTLSFNLYIKFPNGKTQIKRQFLDFEGENIWLEDFDYKQIPTFVFPNYQDYGYGIFLLDEKSRDYVLKNIQNEPDDFLRSMMWGTLWDSVREAELAPADYVELAVKNISTEKDELTIQTILGRVSTAMNYYLSDAQSKGLAPQLEKLLMERMQDAPSLGQRITFYRSFVNLANSEQASNVLRTILIGKLKIKDLELKTKDKFDIITKLITLGDKNAIDMLAYREKTETSDEAKRYAYAARAGIATAENKQKYFNDFTVNKEISESYIETAFAPFNSPKHVDLTLPFLENALKELPNLRRNRKIFFVNGWLGAFIGGQKSEQALQIVNKFLTDNPNLDKDLRLKILENADNLERAVKIRAKYDK